MTDDDEIDRRKVEVALELVDEYEEAQAAYSIAYTETQHLKLVRDYHQARLEAAMKGESGIATVSGTDRVRVKFSSSYRVDVKRLRSQAPDIAAMYEVESTRTSLEVL